MKRPEINITPSERGSRIVLVATGVASTGFIFVAVMCTAMMAMMMRMMGGMGSNGGEQR